MKLSNAVRTFVFAAAAVSTSTFAQNRMSDNVGSGGGYDGLTIVDWVNRPQKILDDAKMNPRMYASSTAPAWTKETYDDAKRQMRRVTVAVEYDWLGSTQAYNVLADYRDYSNNILVSRIIYVDVAGNGIKKEFNRFAVRGKNQDQIINAYGFEGGKPLPVTLVMDLNDQNVSEMQAKIKEAQEIVIADIRKFETETGANYNVNAERLNRKAGEYNAQLKAAP